MLECVPNFSEGTDQAKIGAIVEAIAGAPGVLVLGWESDADHNRSVVTFVGPPEGVTEGAILGAGKAAELIDLTQHQGQHPRVGAADVIPFVPLEGARLEDAVFAAHRAGQEIWKRFGVPAYFYEAAALAPGRRRLEKVRRREFDGLPPDVGMVPTHATAGAAVIGARNFLIAFNVHLETSDVQVARAIARKIRESSGGFAHVKAIGLYLASLHCAQVSMNLTNFAETPLEEVYRAIEAEAHRLGSRVASSQMIGFIPQRAFEMAPEFFRRAENFSESRIIEVRIAQLLN